jgi:hypothetical protein
MWRSAIAVLLLLPAAPTGGGPIRYHLDAAGNVSLAVYDPGGRLVREVLRADPQAAGDHVVSWDGKTREGKPVPPGHYSWKLLETGGLSAQYLLSVGSNYPIGTDLSSSGGPGTHLSPFAVTADATGVYVAANQTENIETGIVKLSRDGRTRLWSQKLPADARGVPVAWEGGRSLDTNGTDLYLLGHRFPQRVHVMDARTGEPLRAFGVDWGPPLPFQLGTNAADGATALALAGGLVVVAYQAHDAICWFDAATGAPVATVRVPAPEGIAADRAGTVYATSRDRVVRLTRARPVAVTLRGHLTKPGPIAVDAANGDVLVFEGGDRQQILRLSKSGTVLARYGAPGGRKDGLYTPESFRDVTAVAANGRGGFFVAEPFAAPRRVAELDARGAVIQEWYGGQPWDTGAAFEPGRPNVLWLASAGGVDGSRYVMRVLIDTATRTWRVHSCYRAVSPENPLMHGSGNEGNLFHVYAHGGVNYLATEGAPSIWRIDEEHWRLLPVTAIGAGVQWNDRNGDGLVQEGEKTPFENRLRRTFAVPHLAETFDLYFVSSASEPCRIRRLAVTSWNEVGAPVYGEDPDGAPVADCPARFAGRSNDGRWAAFLHLDAARDELYAALNPGSVEWCTSHDSFLAKWDRNGRPAWEVGELGPASNGKRANQEGYIATAPGLVYWNLRGIAGVAHDCLVAIDVDGGWASERAQTYVWDRDGLFVGGLMDRPDLARAPEFMYHLGGELAHATVFSEATGDVIFAGNWENEIRLYRISGWDAPERRWIHLSGDIGAPTTARR